MMSYRPWLKNLLQCKNLLSSGLRDCRQASAMTLSKLFHTLRIGNLIMCRFSPLGRGAIGGVGSNPRTQGQPTPLPLPGGERLSGLASVIYLILIPKVS